MRWLGYVFFHLLFDVSPLTTLTNNLFFLSNPKSATAESLNLKQQFTEQLDSVKISHRKKYTEQKKVNGDAIAKKKAQLKSAEDMPTGYHALLNEITKEVVDVNTSAEKAQKKASKIERVASKHFK